MHVDCFLADVDSVKSIGYGSAGWLPADCSRNLMAYVSGEQCEAGQVMSGEWSHCPTHSQ